MNANFVPDPKCTDLKAMAFLFFLSSNTMASQKLKLMRMIDDLLSTMEPPANTLIQQCTIKMNPYSKFDFLLLFCDLVFIISFAKTDQKFSQHNAETTERVIRLLLVGTGRMTSIHFKNIAKHPSLCPIKWNEHRNLQRNTQHSHNMIRSTSPPLLKSVYLRRFCFP